MVFMLLLLLLLAEHTYEQTVQLPVILDAMTLIPLSCHFTVIIPYLLMSQQACYSAVTWYERHGVSNRRQIGCLLNGLFNLTSKKISRTSTTLAFMTVSPRKGANTAKTVPWWSTLISTFVIYVCTSYASFFWPKMLPKRKCQDCV